MPIKEETNTMTSDRTKLRKRIYVTMIDFD